MKIKFIILCLVSQIAILNKVMAQNVAINTSGNPDNSAMLDISNNTLGLLIPRMSTNPLAASAPANGLMIFNNTTNTLNTNTGSTTAPSWSSLWGSAGDNLNGTSGNQFLGTISSIALRFRTANTERMVIDSTTGFVGIGLANITTTQGSIPKSTLQVNGSFATAINSGSFGNSYSLIGPYHTVIAYSKSKSTNDIYLYLPTSASSKGIIYTIKNVGTGKVYIVTVGSETIDGGYTSTLGYTISNNYYAITLQCDGVSNWSIIGNATL